MAIRTARWTRTSPWSLLPQDDTFSVGADIPIHAKAEQHQPKRSDSPITEELGTNTIPLNTSIKTQTNISPTETRIESSCQPPVNDDIEEGTETVTRPEGWSDPMICSELAAEPITIWASNEFALATSALLEPGITFRLHSKPSATKIIYLDFNGHTTSGTSWNGSTTGNSFYSPAYDTDGDPTTFSESELIAIQQIWQRVADDFAPFDIDVTLQEPPSDWLSRSSNDDANWGVRAVITSYGPYSSSAGGVAIAGSFNSAVDDPVFIYNMSITGVCEAISHEVGHSLGLSHDGTDSATYYSGHGGTGETSWAPIMGNSYSRNVTTWDNGSYYGSNNTGSTQNYGSGQDDLARITSINGFSFSPDLVGNDLVSARPLAAISGSVSQFGTIENSFDVDVYLLELGALSNLDLVFDPYWYRAYVDLDGAWGGDANVYISKTSDFRTTTSYPDNAANLDLQVELYDGEGNLIYTSNDAGLATAISLQELSAGTYYLKLDGAGYGDPTAITPTGYTDYASIGNYMITGTITSKQADVITLSLTPSSVSEDGSANLLYTFTRSSTNTNPLTVHFTTSGTATNGTDYTGLAAGSSQTVTFAADSLTASIVINPTNDNTIEDDETVTLSIDPGSNYIIGTNSSITGTIKNDDLASTSLAFTPQSDVLTGTTDGDIFKLSRLTDSLWSSTPDRITNLQAGIDTIDSPFNRSSPITPKQLGSVPTLNATSIERLLTSKNFGKNGAATFTFSDREGMRTFLAINDAVPGFKATNDSVIEITGYTGDISSIGVS